MRLLGTGTERRLLAARLQAVRLENALERLGGGTMAASVTATTCGRGRGESRRHFVLRVRQTFRMNARNKKNGACVYWTSCWILARRYLWGLWMCCEEAGRDAEVPLV